MTIYTRPSQTGADNLCGITNFLQLLIVILVTLSNLRWLLALAYPSIVGFCVCVYNDVYIPRQHAICISMMRQALLYTSLAPQTPPMSPHHHFIWISKCNRGVPVGGAV